MTTITCVGCGAEIDNKIKFCPACKTPVGTSYRIRKGKRRLAAAMIVILLAGFAIAAVLDKNQGQPLPHPHQLLDAPQ